MSTYAHTMAATSRLESGQYEGEHVQLFRVRIQNIFRRMMESISSERFNEIYAKALQGKKSRGRKLFKAWQMKVLEDVFVDLQQICIEEKLDEKLKMSAMNKYQLDDNTIAWRPPGNTEEHIRSLDMHEKYKIKDALEEYAKQKEAALQHLMEVLETGRSHVFSLETRLEADIERLNAGIVEEENAQSMLMEGRKMLTQEDRRLVN